jgi:hypothetical protein
MGSSDAYVTGKVDPKDIVATAMAQKERDGSELASLTTLLADTKWANHTATTNPALYRELKARRDFLKYGSAPEKPKNLRFRTDGV